VGGELALFAQALADLEASAGYAPKVLAVTGTNGKTTVTALTGHLVGWAGKSVAVAGNIGPTLLDTLAASAGRRCPAEVLGAGAVQLPARHARARLRADAATVLNLTPGPPGLARQHAGLCAGQVAHLWRHGLMVLNRDDPQVMAMVRMRGRHRIAAPARVRRPASRRSARCACAALALDVPQQPGDFGLEDSAGMAWLVRRAGSR